MDKPVNNYISTDTEMAEIVLSHPRTLLLLEHLEIMLPIHSKSVSRLCKERNIREGLFITLAKLFMGDQIIDRSNIIMSDLPVIIMFLRNNHTYYHEIYSNIQKSIQKLHQVNNDPEIAMVDRFFQDYFAEVKEHLDYEDEIVFPYMEALYLSMVNKKPMDFQTKYSVIEYKEHHNDIEEKLNDLMSLLIKYLPNKNDQQARRILFMALSEVDFDLNIHSRIEDQILIPLVEIAEDQLSKMS
jgi:regulator of cell morphogenesis and NO signaling